MNNFFAESQKKLSAKNSAPRASRLALGEEILRREFFFAVREEFFKISLFHLHIFFYHQHALIQRICSNWTQFYLCLLYLKILLHSR
jgi:hypothetical protein